MNKKMPQPQTSPLAPWGWDTKHKTTTTQFKVKQPAVSITNVEWAPETKLQNKSLCFNKPITKNHNQWEQQQMKFLPYTQHFSAL